MWYSEQNGLARLWTRDLARYDWAQWVYHHPESVRRLIEILLNNMNANKNNIDSILRRLDENDIVDSHQEEAITNIINNYSETDVSPIELEQLLKLFNEG